MSETIGKIAFSPYGEGKFPDGEILSKQATSVVQNLQDEIAKLRRDNAALVEVLRQMVDWADDTVPDIVGKEERDTARAALRQAESD
jgi:hypothetical protein